MNISSNPIKTESPLHRLWLRGIVIFYSLLFVCGLISSGYFLGGIVELKPIPMLGLLKYILLCILFLVLLINALRAITLNPSHLARLSSSTGNFKWLFTLAVVLCIAGKAGLFDLSRAHPVEISYIQIGVLTVIAIFCYWSDGLLKGEDATREEIEEEDLPEEL
ncbi:hypothetical protein AY601_3403 [Pedobacter cryoconitis]|uniref:DUF2975 domain-containing protein n=1 Tax=Pedobacter cryoconitis TaxID=188932 RepID=A0A127VH75_9SPHI|nr:hypothetical protein [Pedobacter cryoconitis]AMQ00269.1 hypothetical protein AY601_3403 [Pedobacter cryoconitis]